MKYILTLLFIINTAHAFRPDMQLKVHQKYCALKVEGACEAVKCMENLDECTKKQPAMTAEENKAMNDLIKKCSKQEIDCLEKEVEVRKAKALVELGRECSEGKQNSCYQKEILETSR
jgi:hypothetical protein